MDGLGDAGLLPRPGSPSSTPASALQREGEEGWDGMAVREVGGQQQRWVEEILAGSHLGMMRGGRGAGKREDRKLLVEWEFVEFEADGEEGIGVGVGTGVGVEVGTGKRKLGEMGDEEGVGVSS